MDIETKEIDSIVFGIFSTEEIIKNSVAKIHVNKLNGEGSVYDERMGSMESSKDCVSCQMSCKDCPGHFGHIELNYPILHPMYYRFIVSFLKCFCHKCYNFLLTEEHLRLEGILRFQRETRFNKVIEKVEKVDVCYFCETPKPKINFVASESNIYMVFKKTKVLLTEDDIKKIFDNIKDDDVKLLGFDPKNIHPKNLVMCAVPVLPPISRPYIISDSVMCDDDLTIQYLEIIKNNNHLEEKDLNDTKQQKYIQTLKFRIKTLMNNSQNKSRHSNGRPIKAIKERLSGKEGHIRNNLMGKRVNQSARTVIGPDPTVRTDEMVIPTKIAEMLTKPERVTAFNIDALTKIVNNDEAQYVQRQGKPKINLKYAIYKKQTEILPGDQIERDGKIINHTALEGFKLQDWDVIIREGERIQAQTVKKKHFQLQIGDIVERNLRNGDYLLLNRQPTLHQGSMLAKRIIIRPCKTIRFSLASCKTFNADFDGDEMNIHVPQEYDARAELQILSTTKAKMFSPQASKSNVSIVQDSLLSAYLMTISKDKMERETFFNICMHGDGWTPKYILGKIQHIRRVLKELGRKLHAFNGKGLVSMMLPEDFNYTKKNDADPEEPIVRIYKGVMYEGAMNKALLGSSHNSIIQCLFKEYNVDVAMDFINNLQFVSQGWMMQSGFSIGIKDCIPTKTDMIQNMVTKSFVEADSIGQATQHPRIKEAKISMTLNKAKDIGMKLAKDGMLSSDNGFVATITSGSKGDFFNIAQITGLLAQQNVTGQRIVPVLNKGRRTLPHYKFGELPSELEYESKGFIRNSFMKGLNPKEFFLHAMSGREGISDKRSVANSRLLFCVIVQTRRERQCKNNLNRIC